MQTQISFRRPMFSVLSVQYPATSLVFTRYSMLQHKSDDDISMMLKYDDSVSLFIVQDEIENGQIPRQLISVRENWSLTLLVGWRSGQNVTLNFHSFFSFDFLQGVVPGFDLPQLVELLWIHWSKIQNHHWSYLESIWANTNKNTNTPGSDSESSLIRCWISLSKYKHKYKYIGGQIKNHLWSYCWISLSKYKHKFKYIGVRFRPIYNHIVEFLWSGAAVQDHAEEP